MTGTEKKHEPVSKKAKTVNEVGTLEKLIEPSVVIHKTKETAIVESSPLKVPNNPFKTLESQVSVATEVETTDTLFISPHMVPDEEISRKRKPSGVVLCETESITEEASGVTQEQYLDVLCLTPQSQESVNSNPYKLSTSGKKKGKSEKLKSKSCMNSLTKNSSILNFFSRV